jgi:type I restriction enzyme S subunit
MKNYEVYESYKDSGTDWIGKLPNEWEATSLRRLADLVSDKRNTKTFQVGLENIESWTGNFLPTSTEFSGNGVNFFQKDILFGKLRPYLAKAWIAEKDGEAVGDFFVLRCNELYVPNFLHYVILSKELISIIDGSTFGAKMPRCNWNFLADLKIPQPSKPEQIAIASYLDHETAKIDNLVNLYTKFIERLKEKRASLIFHAVTKGLDENAEMKDSGVEWIGNTPLDWKIVKVSSLMDVINGYPFKSDDFVQEDNRTVPLIRIRDIGQRYAQTHISSNNIVAEAGISPKDLLIGLDGDFNLGHLRCASYAMLNQRVCALRAKDKKEDYDLLLEHALPPILKRINDITNSTTVKHLSAEQVRNILIPIPTNMLEYKNLIKHLDLETSKIDKLIDTTYKSIDLLRERRASLIYEAVTGKIDVRDWKQNDSGVSA